MYSHVAVFVASLLVLAQRSNSYEFLLFALFFSYYDTTKEDVDETLTEAPNFSDWVSEGKVINEHPEMGDLAGVRIGVYFPDDGLKVVEKITKHFEEKHRFGTVTGERYATPRKSLDINDYGRGRWYSRNSDGTFDYWKHSGYESWQVVVEWKEPLPEPPTSRRVEIPNNFNTLRVEIQIGTLVSQAWAEVEHKIIYKRPANILNTPTMKQILDAINGLAITTEIMLRELDRSLEKAKREAGMRVFKDGTELLKWLESTYLSPQQPEKRQGWICPQNSADFLIHDWHWLSSNPNRASLNGVAYIGPEPCPTYFEDCVETYVLPELDMETVQGLDICWLVNKAIHQSNQETWNLIHDMEEMTSRGAFR